MLELSEGGRNMLRRGEGGNRFAVCIKCLFFDDEMFTLLKVGGEDSKGRRVL